MTNDPRRMSEPVEVMPPSFTRTDPPPKFDDSGVTLEHTSFTQMPQCSKCGAFDPHYHYVYVTLDYEFLGLTCSRCSYKWTMSTIPEELLS